jgi:4-hydroxy-tetrahydrodipicolinate synthase
MDQQSAPLHGIITAMVTPLTDQDTLDRAGLERLIEHLLAGGVHGLFPLGTTGEAPALPVELRNEIVERTCSQVAGRVPVVVGVTATSLVEATRLARKAKDCGATAIATAPPYYYSLTQDEILRYCEKLVSQAEMPLLLYNQPYNTHHTMGVDIVRRAAEIENIIGLKDSGLSMSYFHEVCASLAGRDDFSLLVGPEDLLAECVLLGGHGGMAGGSNIYPRLYVDLYNAAVACDMPLVVRLHQEALAFNKAVYHGNNPLRGLKCGLELLGICSSVLTEPLTKYTAEESAAVARYIEQNGLKIAQ